MADRGGSSLSEYETVPAVILFPRYPSLSAPSPAHSEEHEPARKSESCHDRGGTEPVDYRIRAFDQIARSARQRESDNQEHQNNCNPLRGPMMAERLGHHSTTH